MPNWSHFFLITKFSLVSSFSLSNGFASYPNPTRRTRELGCLNLIAPVVEYGELKKDGSNRVIAFTGGGLFYWWQAGWISQQKFYPTDVFVGASAGSLSAALAKCEVDADLAFDLAIQLCDEYRVFEEPLGLGGRWGIIVRDWLERLLPVDAAERCRGNVAILVTQLGPLEDNPLGVLGWPPLRRSRIADFSDRADLVDCLMASVHIPFFMDGQFFATFRGKPCIDGSFLIQPGELSAGANRAASIMVDHKDDASLEDGQFLRLKPGPDLVRALIERGAAFSRAHQEPGALKTGA